VYDEILDLLTSFGMVRLLGGVATNLPDRNEAVQNRVATATTEIY
jgi:hypothetical protein